MENWIKSLVAASCISLLLIAGCSDKNSTDACQFQTTMDLDKGNYDAVLQSPCATPMHLGAAYFGKAGYTVTSVINSLVTAQTPSANTALSQYLSSLTGNVTDNTLNNLDSSHTMFSSIPPASNLYQDAQFNLSIVDSIKALSLIKTVIDLNSTGTLSNCDINNNGVPDEADAVTCALLASGIPNPAAGLCTLGTATATWTATTDIFFSGTTGTYRGMVTTLTGTATTNCPAKYNKLLYQAPGPVYNLATTSGICQESSPDNTRSWPCPLTSNIDFVIAIQASLNSSITSLNTALTSTSDVSNSIQNIRSQACGNAVCTPAELANYFQTQL